MNKGLISGAVVIAAILLLSSCDRRHNCFCTYGSGTAPLQREYRGYTVDEARTLCESEEYASTPAQEVKCELL